MIVFKIFRFAMIPSFVILDGAIPPLARLLYVEIDALSHKVGYCYATNKYLGKMNQVDERTIRRLIKILETSNYIKIIIDKTLPNNSRRKIYINPEKSQKCPEGWMIETDSLG